MPFCWCLDPHREALLLASLQRASDSRYEKAKNPEIAAAAIPAYIARRTGLARSIALSLASRHRPARRIDWIPSAAEIGNTKYKNQGGEPGEDLHGRRSEEHTSELQSRGHL